MSGYVAVVDQAEIAVVTVGEPGPRGPAGPAGSGGGSSYLTFTANGPIGGHRAVVALGDGSVGYADNTNPAHANAVVGITLGAAIAGDPVNVQASGEIIEPSWSWMPLAPVFLSTNGLLTQTYPDSGFGLIVGVPTAPDRLTVNIKLPFSPEA